MRKKILSIIIVIMMTSAALIILPKNEFVKAGSFYSNERIGLDYNFIYGAIKDLSEIINNSQYGVYFDIYFGREFATKGELEALNKIRDWIDENTDNLTSTITIEPIGNDSIQGCHEHIMKLVNNKLELMGYGLEFREGSSGPPDVVIPNNESFVFLNRTISGNLEENNITTDEYVKIVWPPLGGENGSTENPLNINYSEYGLNITIYNMSYNRLGTTDSIIFGETTYIEDYSKSSTEEKIDKIHIINVTDENYNNTVESLYDSNASGFILIRDNVSEIKNWSIDVAGVAVSSENGSLLINLTENGTIFTFPTEEEVPLDTGMLQIYHRNDTCINNEKRIYLVNTSWFEDPGPHIIPNWYQLIIFNNIAFKERCKGIILINSLYPQTHLMYPYSKLIRWSKHLSYSRFRSPMFSINGSVIVNGEMKDFMSWVKEQNGTNNPVKANYWILQRKNDSVESYNIYCDVIGEDTTKWIYMSGAHYEAWRGQSTSDNAVGVAQMLGILKYLNDNHITPKCNLRFMFHGGHENLLRGAYSHVFNPENEDVLKHANLMLALDQLGHHFPATFRINASDESMIPLLWAIFDDFDYNETYQETKGYDVRVGGKHAPENGTIEAKIYNRNYRKDFHYVDLDYIEFCKDSLQTYHQTGDNHTRGDTLDIVDRDDVNVTVDMIWSVAKYFTVNPDCWIDSYSATAFDSDDDNDTLKDSINVSFSLKTILPNDIVHVKAELKKTFSINEIVDNCIVDYVINLTYGVQDSIILTVPENVSADFYTLRFYLYNSTGRINDMVDIGLPCSRYNDSRLDRFYLNRFNENVITPYFYNVGVSSQSIGYGSSNTISGCVSSTVNTAISQSQTYVLYPDETFYGYNMTNYEENIYELDFENTWQEGKYQYCIWAVDENGNSSVSDWYDFNISIQANMSVCTMLDEYGNDEYINITDPPNPPENYMLVDRGLTWNKYYDAVAGSNILETFTTPVNYQEDNGTWVPINCSFGQIATNHPAYSYGYRVGNDQGLYNVYFKPNVQSNWPVAFAYNKSDDPTTHVVRSKLVGVGYLDPQSNWAYEFLQSAQNSQVQFTGSKATYENVFTGTDVVWSYDNMELKEKITLSNTTKSLLQNHPPSLYGLQNESSYLVFITKLDYQNLILYNESGNLNGNITVSDGWVAFKDNFGYFKCALPIGDAYELYNESARQKLVYRILQYNGNYYLLSGLKVQNLNNMVFPVVIDPTITVSSSENDGHIYKSGSDYDEVYRSEEGTVSCEDSYISIGQSKVATFPPDYRIRRGFLFFDTSELPSNAYIDNAVLSLFKKDDYSTTDFTIVVQNGQPSYPHDPLEECDYNNEYYSGSGGDLNTINFVNGSNNITLSELGWINIGGVTKLCLRSNRDINGTTPTGSEYVNVYSANAPDVPMGYLPKLIIEYRNQSKIKNTGLTNITGYLFIQVQFLEGEEWVVDQDAVNETKSRTINAGQQLGLDTIFNGLVNTNDLTHGDGLYRVYAAFRDPDGDVLICDDDSLLEASYEFTVTFE